jgi:hypothetical protein
MSQTQTVPKAEKGRQRQQGPKILFKLLNPLMKLILNSPLHGGMSKQVMVLSFTGRKTGKRYSTPVSYTWEEDRVIVVTFGPWWKNFKDPAPVQMRIQGKSVSGTAVFVNDPVRIKHILHTLMHSSGKEMMQRMGLWIEDLDSLSPEAVQQATHGTYFIEVNTKGGQ